MIETMKINRFRASVLIIIGCMAAVVAVKYASDKGGSFGRTISSGNPRSVGRADAPIRIVESIDFQCGACQQASFLLKEYVRKFPSRILLDVKLYPLAGHAHGMAASAAAVCAADQGRFWPVYDMLFERQAEWSPLANPQPVFQDIARTARLDTGKFQDCLADPRTRSRIEEEKTQGYGAGVRSTPSFFINGQMVVGSVNLTKELDKHFGDEAIKPKGP